MDDFEFELEFDNHRYTLNGSEVPATTRILELARKPFDGIPAEVLQHAQDRGKAVHKAVELLMKKDLDNRQLQREIRMRLSRWEQFMEEWKVEPVELPIKNYMQGFFGGVLCEVPMVHPVYCFGVTADVGIAMVDGTLSVIEVKATSSHNDATGLQMASQLNTVNYFFEKHGYKVEERYGVRLVPDQKPDVKRYKDKGDWGTFLSFLNVSNWRKVHKVETPIQTRGTKW